MRVLSPLPLGCLLALLGCQRVLGIGETHVWPMDPDTARAKDAGTSAAKSDASASSGNTGLDASPPPSDGPPAGDGAAGDSAVDVSPNVTPGDAADDGSAPPADVASPPADAGPETSPRCPDPTAEAQVDEFTPQNRANCSYGSYRPTATYAAAVDNSMYAGAGACGACIELSNARGKVVAQVLERNLTPPVGGRNKISTNRAALDQLGGGSVAQAKWRWVPCPTTGSIRAALKEANNPFFLELIVLDFTNRLAKVEFRTSANRVWREAPRQEYNYFLHRAPQGVPTELRLTDGVGNQVTSAANLRWNGTSFISLEAQFPAQCSY